MLSIGHTLQTYIDDTSFSSSHSVKKANLKEEEPAAYNGVLLSQAAGAVYWHTLQSCSEDMQFSSGYLVKCGHVKDGGENCSIQWHPPLLRCCCSFLLLVRHISRFSQDCVAPGCPWLHLQAPLFDAERRALFFLFCCWCPVGHTLQSCIIDTPVSSVKDSCSW